MFFSHLFFSPPCLKVESGDKDGLSNVSNAQQDPIDPMNEATQDRDGNLFFHISWPQH
jgi:hypothetical protein